MSHRTVAEQPQSFEDLRLALTSKPVLQYSDFNKSFVVAMDASQTDVVAVVIYDHWGGLQPVASASATCRKAEAKYGVSGLECMVMAWELEQFRSYFYGRLITLITVADAIRNVGLEEASTFHPESWGLLEEEDAASRLEMNRH